MEATPVLSLIPPLISPTIEVIVKDVTETAPQNINPLNTKDLKKILDQLTEQAKLCKNIVLVCEEEYQKALSDTKVQPSKKFEKTPTKVEVQAQDGQKDQGQRDAQESPKEEE